MSQSKDILRVEVRGPAAKLNVIDARHLADLISAVARVARSVFGGRKGTSSLHLIGMGEDSVQFDFTPSAGHSSIDCVRALERTVNWINSDERPDPAVAKPLEQIVKFNKRYKTSVDVASLANGGASITIDEHTPLPRPVILRGRAIVYGTIQEVGGEERPFAKIRRPGGDVVTAYMTRDMAKELGARLYDFAALRGEERYDPINRKIVEFKAEELLAYRPGPKQEVLTHIREKFGGYFADIDDVDEYVKKLRRGEM